MTGLRGPGRLPCAPAGHRGDKLAADERLLGQFLGFMEANDAKGYLRRLALRWATLPSGASPACSTSAWSAVRGFAAFAASLDEATQIPPASCLPGRAARAVPDLDNSHEVEAALARRWLFVPAPRACT